MKPGLALQDLHCIQVDRPVLLLASVFGRNDWNLVIDLLSSKRSIRRAHHDACCDELFHFPNWTAEHLIAFALSEQWNIRLGQSFGPLVFCPEIRGSLPEVSWLFFKASEPD